MGGGDAPGGPLRAVVLAAVLAVAPGGARSPASAGESPPGAAGPIAAGPIAVIALDGVPFAAAEQAFRRGLFRGFSPPGRLVAPFPAMTTVSFCEMLRPLGVGLPRGYELRYFDHGSHRLRGGGLFEYDDDPAPWKAAFHYNQESLVFKTLAYVSPWLAARYEVDQLCDELESTDLPLFLGYVGATDPIAHTGGVEACVDLLAKLDEELAETARIRADSGRPALRILIVSDHGCSAEGESYERMEGVDLEDEATSLGLPLASELAPGRPASSPVFGLVGFAALHVSPDLGEAPRREVARGLARARGVDLLISWEGSGTVRVLGDGTEALVRYDALRDAYAYEPIAGDPLRLAAIAGDMRRDGELGLDGFAPDAAWWRRTARHAYPDPLRRSVEAFTRLVQNPASMLISFREGYSSHRPIAWAGLALTLKELEGTHGSLDASSTLGMVLASYAPVPDAVRGSEVLELMVPAPLLGCHAPAPAGR